MGKVTFGYIIGWSVLSMVSVHGLVNALSQGGGGGGVELYRCGSLLGYCLLPVVLFAGCAALALPQGCAAAWALAAAAVGWASATASGLLVAIVPGLEGQRALVAWPCGLAYSLFALLTLG